MATKAKTIHDLLKEFVPEQCHPSFLHPMGGAGSTQWWHWEADSAVGEDCEAVVKAAHHLCDIAKDLDMEDIMEIWEVVGKQCLVYAFG